MSDGVLEPGMKVECIDAHSQTFVNATWMADAPAQGAIYTVVHCVVVRGYPCVVLKEIKNTRYNNFAYHARRFRPLRNRSTDISIFREIVDEVKAVKVRKLEDA